MPHNVSEFNELTIVALFVIASVVALVAKRFRFPYTIGLVLAGLVLGMSGLLEPPRLTKELLYAVFLPGLLFEAAFHMHFDAFWKNKGVILSLAVPGVAAAVALTAAILTPVASALNFVEGFQFEHGLVFAALIAATDPLAVVSIFKSLGAPKRLGVLVEGESLLNDGTAVVIFGILFGLVIGESFSLGDALLEFVKVVGLGLVIGIAIGGVGVRVMKWLEDPVIEISLTTIAAYGSFALAESVHASGVIATVTAGMLCGYAADKSMGPSTRIAAENFWEYLVFALNSVVFLLIGTEIHPGALLDSWQPILVGWLAVTVGRALVIAVVGTLAQRTKEKIPWQWMVVLTWGGLRGGLSMVLVLSLPLDYPQREFLLNLVFGVVFLSLIFQGLSMEPLLRWLRVVGGRHGHHEYELRRGALLASRSALNELKRLREEAFASTTVLDALEKEYLQRRADADANLKALHISDDYLRRQEEEAARRRLLMVEKQELVEAHLTGIVDNEAFEKLVADIDERVHFLQNKITH